MAMPPRVTARTNDQILEIELGLALVFEVDRPVATNFSAFLDWAERDALGHNHVRDDARWRRRESKRRNTNAASEHHE